MATPKLSKPHDGFGSLVPVGEPYWYQGWHSPYYNESHIRFRNHIREFVLVHINPNVDKWEKDGKMPFREFVRKAGDLKILAGTAGYPWPVEHVGDKIPGGVLPSEYDAFHEVILWDELASCGSFVGGGGWFAGLCIGLSPVRKFGSARLQTEVVGPCLRGEKIICLAITEPYAGSDVAGLQCEAKKTPDGKFYVVNGEKKWITNGTYADYFVTAVRTSEGRGGISVLLIERGPGVTTTKMDCMGISASGTAYVTFEDVLVPVGNLLGKEGQGFQIIMHNFNHERLQVIVQSNRLSRVCYDEAFKYASKRETFGKKLIDQPVIRDKLAHMIRNIEATHAYTELVVYQLIKMSPEESAKKLGGVMSLLKVQSTRQFEYCAREASQIFGGLAYTKGGQGGKIERLFREARVFTVFAGSEEIMIDFGARQAIKEYEANLAAESKKAKL